LSGASAACYDTSGIYEIFFDRMGAVRQLSIYVFSLYATPFDRCAITEEQGSQLKTRKVVHSPNSRLFVDADPGFAPFAATLDRLRTDPQFETFWQCIWTPPATAEQFVEYAAQLRGFAAHTGGLLGRSPDFLAGIVSAWSANAEHFAERADLVREFHRKCALRNAILTHAISDVSERGRIAEDQLLTVMGRDSDGIYVSGFKQLATLAPHADLLLVYPYRALSPGAEHTALCFVVEPGDIGVTVHIRAGFRGAYESPDRSIDALDEQDAFIEFENAFVPNSRIFIDGSVEQCNTLRQVTGMTHPAWLQALARMAAKAEMYHALAERVLASGRTSVPEPEVVLAKLARFAASTERDFVRAVESGAYVERYRFWAADRTVLLQGIGNFTERVEAATALLAKVAGLDLICPKSDRVDGQGLIAAAPQVSDWTLFTHLASGAYGYRQNKYELAFVGDPDRLAAL
jgi:4-hydroxyphenylacetate 3-monooxygenase